MLVGRLFEFSWGGGWVNNLPTPPLDPHTLDTCMLFVCGTMSPARVDVILVYKMT